MDKLTTERILQLASRPEGFTVTWQWRNDGLRARCRRLMNEGLLVMVYSKGHDTFRKAMPNIQ